MVQKNKIEDLTLNRVGDTDTVIVVGYVRDRSVDPETSEEIVAEQRLEAQVWYSHLFGDNPNSLKGNKAAIIKYCTEVLEAQIATTSDPELTPIAL